MEKMTSISKYVKHSDTIKLMERDPDFRTLECSLVNTLDYLSSRFSVRKHYDYFNEPRNNHDHEMLFKVNYQSQDIMWVYLIHSDNSSYMSVELDPEKVKSIREHFSVFDKIVQRKTKPRLKLIYREYHQIEQTLKLICDCFEDSAIVSVNDINTPMKPKGIFHKSDGTIKCVCGRCSTSFVKSPRCPECGQLVKE